ncbi:putative salivary secreted serine protease inhibitor [Anopheles sinensis]|uniref:Putative salivary secreted serine protease inhibitor n=1 Tax=Anopheles sinensis TaxID=74873 RepID=A0A084W6A3_ANOSI|nr:putative salivary secreted serine protease inhibitor [Anopheles sinensis]
MVGKITSLLVALSVMVLFVQAQVSDNEGGDCGINEFYTTCGSGCGDQRCFAKYRKGVYCPDVCRVGCYCVAGTARNTTGSCVPVNECA